jgi:hypothetical protein
MKTRLDLTHYRVDSVELPSGEWFVTMTSNLMGSQVGCTRDTKEEALNCCIREAEYQNDYECLKYGHRRLHQFEPWENPPLRH